MLNKSEIVEKNTVYLQELISVGASHSGENPNFSNLGENPNLSVSKTIHSPRENLQPIMIIIYKRTVFY